MTQSGSNLNYLIQDENGQVIKIIRHSEVKKESGGNQSSLYNIQQQDSGSGPKYARLQSSSITLHHAENLPYVNTSESNKKQRQQTIVKYENGNNTIKNEEGKVQKFNIVNNNQTQAVSASSKSKPNSSTNTPVQISLPRRRKSDKVGKGLRHFSMRVCEKVKDKGITTYNEVADELVSEEFQSFQSFDSAICDQKNIRRRVYDALNVLMAMNIISKDKKEIRWIGLPTNSVQQCNTIEKENQERRERIKAKEQQLKELILQQVSFKTLIERNKEAEKQGNIPTPNSSIQLPFIIVNTHKTTKINCSVSTDKSEYYFKFNDEFEIHDDVEVLKRMGLLNGLDKGECTYADIERAKTMVSKIFEKYIELYGGGVQENISDDWEMSYLDTEQTSTSCAVEKTLGHDEEVVITAGSDIE